MENTNEIKIIVKDKKPTSEAVKRAKAKYYQKKKLDEAYLQDIRDIFSRSGHNAPLWYPRSWVQTRACSAVVISPL